MSVDPTNPTMGLAETRELEERYLMRTYRRGSVDFVRGEGLYLYDAEGRQYLDFLAGISVCSLGHCNPAVVAAVTAQTGLTEPYFSLLRSLSCSDNFFQTRSTGLESGLRLRSRSASLVASCSALVNSIRASSRFPSAVRAAPAAL